jgi:hypothetical protein
MDRTPVIDEEALHEKMQRKRIVKVPWRKVPTRMFAMIEVLKDARIKVSSAKRNIDRIFFDINRFKLRPFLTLTQKLFSRWKSALENRKRFDVARLYNCGCNGQDYDCNHYVRFNIPESNLSHEKTKKMIKFSITDRTIMLKSVADDQVPDVKERN